MLRTIFLLFVLWTNSIHAITLNNELDCLTANIYYEGRGEPLVGQVFIGYVTLNRVEHKKWPNSICKVIKQKNQFSWYISDNVFPKEEDAWLESKSLANALLKDNVKVINNKSLFFNNPKTSKSKNFFKKLEILNTINNHRFYR